MLRAVGGSKILSEMWLAEPQWAQTIGKRLVRGRDGASLHLLLGVSAGPWPSRPGSVDAVPTAGRSLAIGMCF